MLNRLKVSFVLIVLAIIVVVGAYIYSLWAVEKQKAAEIPVEATSMMTRDLLAYHKKRGSFPGDLKQLERVVWERKQDRNYSIGNRALSHRNYFYLYTRLDHHKFTLWAVPMGQSREEAATWFWTVTPYSSRRWKGGALPLEHIRKMSVFPSAGELGVLGLSEQPTIVFPKM